MGVTKDLIVTIEARKDNTGPIDCTFDIVSKHDIYKVRIDFYILFIFSKIQIAGEIINETLDESDRLKTKSKLPPLNSEVIFNFSRPDFCRV